MAFSADGPGTLSREITDRLGRGRRDGRHGEFGSGKLAPQHAEGTASRQLTAAQLLSGSTRRRIAIERAADISLAQQSVRSVQDVFEHAGRKRKALYLGDF
jgi:hypothetical protein